MKRTLLLLALSFTAISYGQTVVYSNTFESSPGISLNTTDMSSTTAGENPWIINNIYAGGAGNFICNLFGTPTSVPFNVPAAPSQPAGITNNPNSTYLHVTPQIAIDAGGNLPVASYVAADGVCIIGSENTFAAMDNDFSTTGYDSVSIDLWWMCGGSTVYYGEVYYSTDSGSSWTALTCPTTGTTQWRTQTNWINQAITDAGLADQSTLRLGFRFVSGNNSTGATDPGFAIDDITITGYTLCQETSSSITESACDIYTSPAGNTYSTSGTYSDTIMNVEGCDSVIAINLTINTVDTGVTPSGTALTSDESGATYQWLDCDNANAPISGATSQTYLASMNGNYAVEITINGCTDTSACYSVEGIGFEEDVFGDAVKLYPNPTEGHLFIEVSHEFDKIEVEVKSLEGKLVSKQVFSNSELIQLELNGERGVYLIEVKAGDKSQHYRVVKH